MRRAGTLQAAKRKLGRAAARRWESDRIKREGGLTDYKIYYLTLREWAVYTGVGILFCLAASYIFYRSWLMFCLFLPVGFCYPFYKRKGLKEQRKEMLRVQFKEAIRLLASSLRAGYSVENAFAACLQELEELYGRDGMITKEFSYIAGQLRMNRTVEQLLMDFAKRSDLDEIQNFAEIFAVSKRSRGELVSVVNHAVHVISDKIQVREEIVTMTAEKKLEQKIMNLMPFFIVLYIDLSFPGFFSQMYQTAAGRIVMTVCLGVYLLSCMLSAWIMRIEI